MADCQPQHNRRHNRGTPPPAHPHQTRDSNMACRCVKHTKRVLKVQYYPRGEFTHTHMPCVENHHPTLHAACCQLLPLSLMRTSILFFFPAASSSSLPSIRSSACTTLSCSVTLALLRYTPPPLMRRLTCAQQIEAHECQHTRRQSQHDASTHKHTNMHAHVQEQAQT